MLSPEWLEDSFDWADPESLMLAAERMAILAQIMKAKDKIAMMQQLGVTKADLIDYVRALPAQQIHLNNELGDTSEELRCRINRSKGKVVTIKGADYEKAKRA